jgi:hypothetical protein
MFVSPSPVKFTKFLFDGKILHWIRTVIVTDYSVPDVNHFSQNVEAYLNSIT